MIFTARSASSVLQPLAGGRYSSSENRKMAEVPLDIIRTINGNMRKLETFIILNCAELEQKESKKEMKRGLV